MCLGIDFAVIIFSCFSIYTDMCFKMNFEYNVSIYIY